MLNFGKDRKFVVSNQDQCGVFHDILESSQPSPGAELDTMHVLAQLPIAAREHAKECPTCLESVDDFVAIRNLLLPLIRDVASPTPGPWFSAKVMNAITTHEQEGDGREAVWVGVRKLAPRLAAFCALLLALAGTWAFQVQQKVQAGQAIRPVESIFEPTPAAPLNDDVIASVGDRR
jgi:hypothetical protein